MFIQCLAAIFSLAWGPGCTLIMKSIFFYPRLIMKNNTKRKPRNDTSRETWFRFHIEFHINRIIGGEWPNMSGLTYISMLWYVDLNWYMKDDVSLIVLKNWVRVVRMQTKHNFVLPTVNYCIVPSSSFFFKRAQTP